MMGTKLEITVNGRWLSPESWYGDVEMSTVCPGGSDEVTWTPAGSPPRRPAGGEDVIVYYGGVPVWRGHLNEPDPSQDQLTATGAFREGEDYAALDGSGNANKVVDTVVDAAIVRDLNWTRPTSINTSSTGIDITQGPVTVAQLLDRHAENSTVRWGVDPYRRVYAVADPTGPSYQTLPIAGGLGYALDGYASTLIGRYLETATGTYKTVTVTDTDAEAIHGHVETVIDLTNRGSISTTVATNHVTSILNLGKSIPRWTKSVEVVYGEILTMGGAPVALETVAAGNVLRVNGGYELTQRSNGAMFVDFVIGRTQLVDGTLTISPIQIAARTFTDALS